jgi:hypothetical protein
LGPLAENSNTFGDSEQVEAETIAIEASEDLLNDTIQEESSEDEVEIVDAADSTTGEVYHDNRLVRNNGYKSEKAVFPCEYFLHFLPIDQLIVIVTNINIHARSVNESWRDLTSKEYLKWIALLTVMTVVHHAERKAYWHHGPTHFLLS